MTLNDLRDLIRSDITVNRQSSGLFGLVTAVVFRIGQFGVHGNGMSSKVASIAYAVLDNLWTKSVIGSDIPAEMTCGRALCLPHGGRGVFINSRVKIGDNVTIQQQVTLGNRPPHPAAPCIGSNVQLGAKCSVIGAVTIGDGARVGAHALILRDVSANDTVVGVPGRSTRE